VLLIGVATGVAFGSSYQIVAAFPPACSHSLSLGFVSSGVLVLILDCVLRIGALPSRAQQTAFLGLIGAAPLVGLAGLATALRRHWGHLQACGSSGVTPLSAQLLLPSHESSVAGFASLEEAVPAGVTAPSQPIPARRSLEWPAGEAASMPGWLMLPPQGAGLSAPMLPSPRGHSLFDSSPGSLLSTAAATYFSHRPRALGEAQEGGALSPRDGDCSDERCPLDAVAGQRLNSLDSVAATSGRPSGFSGVRGTVDGCGLDEPLLASSSHGPAPDPLRLGHSMTQSPPVGRDASGPLSAAALVLVLARIELCLFASVVTSIALFPLMTFVRSSGLLGNLLPQALFAARICSDILGRVLARTMSQPTLAFVEVRVSVSR